MICLTVAFETHIGKKYTIYLPKAIVKILTLKEGQKILLKIVGNTLIVESLKDPIQLALTCKKFASITPEKIEEISLEKQATHAKSIA